jgi:hypothetical protein
MPFFLVSVSLISLIHDGKFTDLHSGLQNRNLRQEKESFSANLYLFSFVKEIKKRKETTEQR